MKIGIIKPGFDIIDIQDIKEDKSTFGGMFEIKGLYDDLKSLGHEVFMPTPGLNEYRGLEKYDMLFIFGSIHKIYSESIKAFKGIKVQCITDMNLIFNASEIGEHEILTQVANSPNYHSFEQYIVRYLWDGKEQKIEDWDKREYNCVYGGGTRFGNRDADYRRYLNNEFIDKVYTSSELPMRNKHPKIPMKDLLIEYKKSKFGLVLKDEIYKAFNFNTQRPYEYMICGMIPVNNLNRMKNALQHRYVQEELLFKNYKILRSTFIKLKNTDKLKLKIETWLENR